MPQKQPIEITIVRIPQRSWRWAWRCEIRVHHADVDPYGRGYRDRCLAVYGDYDARHRGPRSRLGRAIADIKREYNIS